ncbi:DUF2087 domain-containing protein [Marinactinospora rubrisoli]|uniref:DUF2087 domain-containing protein n=1 Tax=Marinactinospora rubrisoli TaxID=2715399 RepID=A0ABW2KEK1_9ACTN
MPDDERVRLLGLISAPERLRVFAALVLGTSGSEAVAERAGLPLKDALRALSQLEQGGLVGREGVRWTARPEVLRNAVAAASPPRPRDDLAEAEREEAAVFRAYTREGRITAMPAHRSRRLVLLDHIARIFEPGVRYTEAEVNAFLHAFHEDHAMLRRLLVDEGFLDRDAYHYWRCGGTVEV